jgi:hypothetical protein
MELKFTDTANEIFDNSARLFNGDNSLTVQAAAMNNTLFDGDRIVLVNERLDGDL